ncbi:putative disease resistance protein RGA3 [Oryza brachyantha]|nr:putative disease resistance protein RGA3 [Oryza brachyantha]
MPAPVPAAAPWPVSQEISYLAERLLAHADGDAGLRDLAAALLRVQPVAGGIEKRRGAAGADLTEWLLQLKDAVAEADDLLDELLERRRSRLGPALASCVARGKPSREVKRLVGRIDRIHDGSERLVDPAEEAGEAGFGVRSPNRVTGSVLTERKVIGREKECGEIVSRLVDSADETCSSDLPAVAIVGHGGMGKTTVAQFVYNSERIERHFDLRAWVCVWDRSDAAELTRQILQSIGVPDYALYGDSSAELEILQAKLEVSIMSKRFLLVLDDVWNDEGKTELENKDLWKKVLAPLRSAVSGSKILVTTRMKLVAEFLNSTHVVPIDVLEMRDCWLLLKEAALGGESMGVPPDLQEIGRTIAANAKGSPLVSKALGQMLRNTSSTWRWKTLLDTEISHSIIMSSLQHSYQHLPVHLQRCFAYCSIFPRGWRFHRDKLVKMWVAVGFIQLSSKKGKSEYDLAQEYFHDLLSRSFFCMASKDNQTLYFLNDLMHDLAQHASAHDCIKIDESMPGVIPPTVRHLSISTDYFPQLKNKCRLGRLRTLFVLRSSSLSLSHLPSKFLSEFKNLRVLDLSESDILELPETISQLLHLHYLALCRMTSKLPKCVYRFLQNGVLDMPLLLFSDSHSRRMSKLVRHKTS